MIRLFVALKIPAEIRKQIITLRNGILGFAPENLSKENSDKTLPIITQPMLMWEPEEKLHLTLKFIGEVKADLLDDIINSISFITDYKKFNCSFTGFGFFFKRNEPKILWAGFEIERDLFELADRLNKNFIKFSIPAEERRFKAHITLLRIKKNIDKELVYKFEKYRMNEIPFQADEVALFKSELLPTGSKYTELKNFKLN